MTQEEKELVKEDICERLHYGISVLVHDTFPGSVMPYENVFLKVTNVSDLIDNISLNERYYGKDLFNKIIKQHKEYLEFYPYLRQISSMTEKEFQELHSICPHSTFNKTNVSGWIIGIDGSEYGRISRIDEISKLIDWLNAHYFDYRGLIEKGLALEAEEGMYNI